MSDIQLLINGFQSHEDTLVKLWGAVSELQERNYNLLSRDEIREYAEAGMITPFVGEKVSHESAEIWDSGGASFNQYNQLVLPAMGARATQKVISYGLGHFGYDIRIGSEFQVFSPNPEKAAYIDPKNFDSALLRPVTGDCFIPPNSYALGVSVEKFDIPDDIMCVVLGKSTYARCGIIVNVTPGEPGWIGHWTIEISNSTPLPARIYANEGIAQVLFFRGPKPSTNYAQVNGKYMHQSNKVVLARV